jgi:hypothetical protein
MSGHVSSTGKGEMQARRNLKERGQSKLLGKNDRIILKYILKAKNGSVRK